MHKTSKRWSNLINVFRSRFVTEEFCRQHRRTEKDFTRDRLLTFPIVVLLLLQKTTRSIQRHTHDFFRQLWPKEGSVSVTPGAWTQARGKLRHTAFIELNKDILQEFYSPEQ